MTGRSNTWPAGATAGVMIASDEQDIAELGQIVAWLGRRTVRITKDKSLASRWTRRAFVRLREITDRCPDMARELDDLELAMTEAGRAAAPVVSGPRIEPCDLRALIRRDRGYLGQAGPPPRRENGLDARLLSRRRPVSRRAKGGCNSTTQGSVFTRTDPSIPQNQRRVQPGIFRAASVRPQIPARRRMSARGPPAKPRQ